jgi:hypothetical protein
LIGGDAEIAACDEINGFHKGWREEEVECRMERPRKSSRRIEASTIKRTFVLKNGRVRFRVFPIKEGFPLFEIYDGAAGNRSGPYVEKGTLFSVASISFSPRGDPSEIESDLSISPRNFLIA